MKKRQRNKKYRIKGTPGKELKRSLKAVNWKLVLRLFCSFVLIFTVYAVFVYFKIIYIVHIYAIALLALSVAYVILCRGMSPTPLTEENLPDDWDASRRAEYIEADTKRKSVGKKLLVFIIPILFTFMIDILYINYFSDMG